MGRKAMSEAGEFPVGASVTFVYDDFYDMYIQAIVTGHVRGEGDKLVAYKLRPDIPKEVAECDKLKMSEDTKTQQAMAEGVQPERVRPRWDGRVPACPLRTAPRKVKDPGDRLAAARSEFGPNLGYEGAMQDGLGPEMWGISLGQLEQVMKHAAYRPQMTMYEVVEEIVKPETRGRGMGYALMLNRDEPLLARVMVSHAWMEEYEQFLKALADAKKKGPFWVCAFAIYQPEDIPELSIERQLGPSPGAGPFAAVLRQAAGMVAVMTEQGDIYSRLWCVYEIFMAIDLGVPVVLTSYNEHTGYGGSDQLYHNAIADFADKAVDSCAARCGDPALPPNADELAIRAAIEAREGGYELIDRVVEWCRFQSLAKVYGSSPWYCQTTRRAPCGGIGGPAGRTWEPLSRAMAQLVARAETHLRATA